MNKMVCVEFSPATVLLSKRMDPEALSLSIKDVLLYTLLTIKINLLRKGVALLTRASQNILFSHFAM